MRHGTLRVSQTGRREIKGGQQHTTTDDSGSGPIHSRPVAYIGRILHDGGTLISSSSYVTAGKRGAVEVSQGIELANN